MKEFFIAAVNDDLYKVFIPTQYIFIKSLYQKTNLGDAIKSEKRPKMDEKRISQIHDRDPQVRKLIAVNLESWDYHIKEAETDFEAIFFLKNSPPDLLLLNLTIECEQVQFSIPTLREFFHSPIILIADRHFDAEISRALDVGATDFITKPFRSNEVLTRVNKALDVPRKASDRNHIFSNGSSWNNLSLTETESHLLALLSSHDGKLFTIKSLIRKVVGGSAEDGSQQIKSLVAQLRKKIEKDPDRPVHIITEMGIGYRFVSNT